MESMRNKEFDNKLKVKLSDFAPPVPPNLWNNIEEQLNTQDTPKIKQVQKNRISFFWYGAIAATFLISFTFWKFGENERIYLRKESPILVSETPLANDQHLTERSPQPENLASTKNQAKSEARKEPQEIAISALQSLEAVDLGTEINAKIEDDYRVQFVEPIFSIALSPSKTSRNNEEELLSENRLVLLKESNTAIEEIESPRSKKLGVSTILNLLAKGLNNGEDNLIEFSESEEGILKLDLKLGFAKSKD